MESIKTVCLYCWANLWNNKIFEAEIIKLGRYLSENNVSVIYWGGNAGLMWRLADSVLESNWEIIGIIPRSIADEFGHKNLKKLYIVDSMHERKQKMFELSDWFIAFPWWVWTLEEIFEIITRAKLGFHNKPFGFLNIEHYYDKLFDFLNFSVKKGFVKKTDMKNIFKESKIETLLKKFNEHNGKSIKKSIIF